MAKKMAGCRLQRHFARVETSQSGDTGGEQKFAQRKTLSGQAVRIWGNLGGVRRKDRDLASKSQAFRLKAKNDPGTGARIRGKRPRWSRRREFTAESWCRLLSLLLRGQLGRCRHRAAPSQSGLARLKIPFLPDNHRIFFTSSSSASSSSSPFSLPHRSNSHNCRA